MERAEARNRSQIVYADVAVEVRLNEFQNASEAVVIQGLTEMEGSHLSGSPRCASLGQTGYERNGE
ncbi:hypothetical protein M8312_04780 [Sphingomonas sp. KRR8]|uniref:hypothetical protein n=1 Tax=Sphingomonas sp. KRR8 TaxID=2942996 RepID=UPI002020CF44|nr:hypothetical protein [Sphingomonas sp. KRR8]URD61830.1 hypothetical protein M8312_04780 [Sphingomonas sp. KRR8]